MAKKVIYLLLALTGTFLAVFLSTQGSENYSSFGGSVSAWINDTFFFSSLSQAELGALSRFGWKAFGHVLLYLLTGLFYYLFLSCFPGLRYKKAILLGIGLVVAVSGEVTQLFTPSRSATMTDIGINFVSFWTIPAIRILLKETR